MVEHYVGLKLLSDLFSRLNLLLVPLQLGDLHFVCVPIQIGGHQVFGIHWEAVVELVHVLLVIDV